MKHRYRDLVRTPDQMAGLVEEVDAQ